jgi:RNA polymerase sigma-70 factor, ECF subfamily
MGISGLFCRGGQFKRAIEESRPRLFRMALAWCGQVDLADDLCQEALTRALVNQQQLRSMEKFDAWIFTILSNCWREHLRRRRPQVEFEESEHADKRRSIEEDHQRKDLVAHLKHEVARLPEMQRQVLTLVDLEEFSYAETADILEIPPGTVMSRLHRARAQLRVQLNEVLGKEMDKPLLRRVK